MVASLKMPACSFVWELIPGCADASRNTWANQHCCTFNIVVSKGIDVRINSSSVWLTYDCHQHHARMPGSRQKIVSSSGYIFILMLSSTFCSWFIFTSCLVWMPGSMHDDNGSFGKSWRCCFRNDWWWDMLEYKHPARSPEQHFVPCCPAPLLGAGWWFKQMFPVPALRKMGLHTIVFIYSHLVNIHAWMLIGCLYTAQVLTSELNKSTIKTSFSSSLLEDLACLS